MTSGSSTTGKAEESIPVNGSKNSHPLALHSLTQEGVYHFRRHSGASDGNRTRVICLEGRGFTIKLHSRTPNDLSKPIDDRQSEIP